MTFPEPLAAPPTTLLAEKMATPSPVFPRTDLPAESRPMILFTTELPVAVAPVISTPAPALAEMTFCAELPDTPTMLSGAFSIMMPLLALPG